MSGKSKNDLAWESLFDTHRILDNINSRGLYEISSNAINEVRDSRSMTAFNHRIQLPGIFKQNGLSIQPKSRSSYLIGHFTSYFDLPRDVYETAEEVPFPATLETI